MLNREGGKKLENFCTHILCECAYTVLVRAVDPNSFFANPDPSSFSQYGSGSSCFLNADPDPALCKKLPYEELSVEEKKHKKLLRNTKKNNVACENLF